MIFNPSVLNSFTIMDLKFLIHGNVYYRLWIKIFHVKGILNTWHYHEFWIGIDINRVKRREKSAKELHC
jgi:hypothetical protein